MLCLALLKQKFNSRNDLVDNFKRELEIGRPAEMHFSRLAHAGPFEIAKGEGALRDMSFLS